MPEIYILKGKLKRKKEQRMESEKRNVKMQIYIRWFSLVRDFYGEIQRIDIVKR